MHSLTSVDGTVSSLWLPRILARQEMRTIQTSASRCHLSRTDDVKQFVDGGDGSYAACDDEIPEKP